MVLSRGLVISIGVSALGCTLLFLYFRNKINSVEKKVDLMFDLIQNYEQEQPHHEQTSSNNLIEVSDNDDDDVSEGESQHADDDDSENEDGYDDDSEEVSDDEEPKLISLETSQEINLGENDVSNIDISENITKELTKLNEIELGEPIEDSLDELDDDDDDNENVVNNEVKVAAEDDEEEDEDEENEVDDDEENTVEEIIDYKKLKVAELKALARDKGLSNYANLKKQPLIELLKAN